MKPCTRHATAHWSATGQHGKGTVNLPGAALNPALYAAASPGKRRGTNPVELLAAAHAASFTFTLANELAEAGYNPHLVSTTTKITMEHHAAGRTLAQIELEVIAFVPKVAEGEFVDAALRAKANCPISRVLTANISMRARLDSPHTMPMAKPRPLRVRRSARGTPTPAAGRLAAPKRI